MKRFMCCIDKDNSVEFHAVDYDQAKSIRADRYGKYLGVAEIIETTDVLDITKHEFSNFDFSVKEIENGDIHCDVENGPSGERGELSFTLNSHDIIIMFKALGLTAEDLK